MGLILSGASFGPAWAALILGALSILAERRPVRVNSNVELTASLLPVVFAAVMFGPLSAMAVGALGLVVTFHQPYTRWLIWTCTRSLGAGLAGVAASLILVDELSAGRLFGAVAVAAFVNSAFDTMMGALVIRIRRSGDSLSGLRLMKPILLGTVPLYTAVLVLLIYAYEEFSGWSLFLFLVPAFAAHRLHGLYREQRERTDQLRVANDRLENANLSFAVALVAALDARDQYTAGHSAAVAVYARDIASRLGLSEECQQTAHLCGLVHDIGKVGLPAGLLEKPGALTLEERRRMEEHSAIGERILQKVDDYAEIAWIVRHHHERMDGNGYPDRLRGEEIPLISRIIAVADAYNAMTSGRPYRDAMPSRVARFRLAQASGTQFDTTVVAAFEAILAGAGEPYLSGVRADFAVEAQRQPDLLPQAVASVA
ncbi:MAG: HD domain-containing protein [Candidatus Rokuibacteriota bacterium]|nr:MAG: HD domain-containing protein [Candidatus Rokubacteria bacterium]